MQLIVTLKEWTSFVFLLKKFIFHIPDGMFWFFEVVVNSTSSLLYELKKIIDMSFFICMGRDFPLLLAKSLCNFGYAYLGLPVFCFLYG